MKKELNVTLIVSSSTKGGICRWGYKIISAKTPEPFYGELTGCAANMKNIGAELSATMRAIKHVYDACRKSGYIPNLTIKYNQIGVVNWATGAWTAKNEFTVAYANFMHKYMAGPGKLEFVKL